MGSRQRHRDEGCRPAPWTSEDAIMGTFKVYVSALNKALEAPMLGGDAWDILYGAPAAVKSSYRAKTRKALGIYFTHPALADKLAHRLFEQLKGSHSVLDPAMGAGDLLLSCAKALPRRATVDETLRYWGQRLRGYDRSGIFVETAMLRLALLARLLLNAGPVSRRTALESFPAFLVSDFLRVVSLNDRVRCCVIANPPFTMARRRYSNDRGASHVSTAALFLEKLYRDLPQDTHIVGVFPEVLRCGSTYQPMRVKLFDAVGLIHEESLGRFARGIDIDIFMGHYKTGASSPRLSADVASVGRQKRLDEYFSLKVGSVVPHRKSSGGRWRRFASAKNVSPLHRAFVPEDSIRYWGPVYQPPFVVVRRTSSPKQRLRAVATVVVGSRPVAVENHLLVLQPKDGRLETCRSLLDAITSTGSSAALNDSMRCRHLTVESLASLPVTF